jgi:AcrR family transcriptional regulator
MTATRLTAAERREAVLEVPLVEFAAHGYEGASTDEIARRVGISQPYVFGLFGTKKDLFKAAVGRSFSETLEAFRAGGRRQAGLALEAIGASYIELVSAADLGCSAACRDRAPATIRKFARSCGPGTASWSLSSSGSPVFARSGSPTSSHVACSST